MSGGCHSSQAEIQDVLEALGLQFNCHSRAGGDLSTHGDHTWMDSRLRGNDITFLTFKEQKNEHVDNE